MELQHLFIMGSINNLDGWNHVPNDSEYFNPSVLVSVADDESENGTHSESEPEISTVPQKSIEGVRLSKDKLVAELTYIIILLQ